MSKAFTSEENQDDGFLDPPALPPGVKNYMTKTGAERLRAELEGLERERRAHSMQNVSGQAQLGKIERRLRFLVSRLEPLETIDPTQQPKDQVLFGATVTLRTAAGQEERWRIVGLDESDLAKGWISWMSPFAQALLTKRLGDTLQFRDRTLTVHALQYEP